MIELTFSNNLLKIQTNKNSGIFLQAGELLCNSIVGKVGVIYDDFDYKGNLKDIWKQYKLDKIFVNAPRRKTSTIDDKIQFHKVMNDSAYTPESYLTYDEITDKTGLYFVKKRGSTGGNGVNIYNYNDLLNADITNSVIQKNISNPDLYQNKLYKIRQLVLLYDNNVYLQKNSYFTLSSIDYNSISSDNLRNAYVINQCLGNKLDLTTKLEDFDSIFKNIILAVKDFKTSYQKVINTINGNEYCVLGFDFIVNSEKNVQIIEINHRSNYSHPKHVSLECDITFFKDMFKLLMTNNEVNNFILI